MITLDCESFNSALSSVAGIYGANAPDVRRFLSSTKLTDYSELKPMFESRFGPPKKLDTVCWFHLTRVRAGTEFSEGILPLHDALETIWSTLISVLSNEQQREKLRQMKKEGVPNHLYVMKTGNRLHSGPYAMFIKEVAFQADAVGNHDYLEFPEIVEDICNGYETKFGESIREEINEKLRKCIVKVELPASSDDEDLLYRALLYCWCTLHGEQPNTGSNTCLDGEGRAIGPEAIRKIEFVP